MPLIAGMSSFCRWLDTEAAKTWVTLGFLIYHLILFGYETYEAVPQAQVLQYPVGGCSVHKAASAPGRKLGRTRYLYCMVKVMTE